MTVLRNSADFKDIKVIDFIEATIFVVEKAELRPWNIGEGFGIPHDR